MRQGLPGVALRKNLSIERGDNVLFEEHRFFFYITNDRTLTADQVVAEARLVVWRCDPRTAPMQKWFAGEYREVLENERLVYTESMSDENGNALSPADIGMPEGHPMTEVRVELEDVGGCTKMITRIAALPFRTSQNSILDSGFACKQNSHTTEGGGIDGYRCPLRVH